MARATKQVIATWLSRKPDPKSSLVAIAGTALLLLGSLIFWSSSSFAPMMAASQEQVFRDGQIWRLWTTIFAHADFAHLASNSFLFFILSYFLYGYFGLRVFPLAAIFWGGVTNAIVLQTYDPAVRLVGASGVVYWLGGAWLTLYFALSKQKNFKHRVLRSLGVAIMLFMPSETFQPQVSHRTHFTGFVLGIVFGIGHYLLYYRKFKEAEVVQTIVEDTDPEDDMPGPEGFSEYNPNTSKSRFVFKGADLARIEPTHRGLRLLIADAQTITEKNGERETSPVNLILEISDGQLPTSALSESPIVSTRLEIETMTFVEDIPRPFHYAGQVKMTFWFEDGNWLEAMGTGFQIFSVPIPLQFPSRI